MKKEKNLKLNAVMNAVLTMSSFLFSLITYPYVARVLGPAGTGRVLFVHSLTTYFNMFAQLGIPVYGVRACAAVRDNKEELSKTAQELLLLNLIMSLFSFLFLGAGILAIPRLRDEKTLIILMDDPIKAVIFLGFCILLQQFDGNFLGPRILGDRMGISGFWILFAIMIFSAAWGIPSAR